MYGYIRLKCVYPISMDIPSSECAECVCGCAQSAYNDCMHVRKFGMKIMEGLLNGKRYILPLVCLLSECIPYFNLCCI